MTTMPPPTRRATTAAAQTTDWMKDGLCRQIDAEIFFPEGRGGSITVQTRQAKRVCAGCPVQAVCRQWAIDTQQPAGVWGGLSEEDRLNLRGRTKRDGRLDGLTALDNILLNRLEEFRALDERGLGELQVADALATNVQTIRRVRQHLATNSPAEAGVETA